MWLLSTSHLVVSTFKLFSVGNRVFQVPDPRDWSKLPEEVVSAPLLPTFQCRLKTLLFHYLDLQGLISDVGMEL